MEIKVAVCLLLLITRIKQILHNVNRLVRLLHCLKLYYVRGKFTFLLISEDNHLVVVQIEISHILCHCMFTVINNLLKRKYKLKTPHNPNT